MLTDVLQAAGGQLPVGEACGCVVQVAVRLRLYHEQGIIHQDLRTENLVVSKEGVVTLRDVNLARFDDVNQKYDENVLGTADYLAPEQALDSLPVDFRADIYSLGIVLYHILTGQVPFEGGSVAQKLIWHQTRVPAMAHTIRFEMPKPLSRIIAKMMEKKPVERYQSMMEVISALRPFVVPAPPGICPPMAAAALASLP